MSLLEEIIGIKQREVDSLKKQATWLKDELPAGNRGLAFERALERGKQQPLQIIAECKKASPSRGLLCKQYDPERIAAAYRQCGAAAVSVLTESKFFQGDISHLALARKCGLPILRKDFIISPLQIYQAKHAGADAILLIVRLLSSARLKELHETARQIGLAVLVEIHSEAEAASALEVGARIVGINHRDLESLHIDISLTSKIAPWLRKTRPDSILIAESGIENHKNRERVQEYVDGVLVGTALMESEDIAGHWRDIFG